VVEQQFQLWGTGGMYLQEDITNQFGEDTLNLHFDS
jgi:hypothetical protein